MLKGYCVKCKKKDQEMEDTSIAKNARGVYMVRGKCKTCGTNMCAMMSKDNAEKAIEEGAENGI